MVPAAQHRGWVRGWGIGSGGNERWEGCPLGAKLLRASPIGFVTVFNEAIQEITQTSSATTKVALD